MNCGQRLLNLGVPGLVQKYPNRLKTVNKAKGGSTYEHRGVNPFP